jgi:predicted transposase/invertase (TIGR01784 family)
MPTSPHDALFKSTFEHPDIARGELELILPADVRAHFDLATIAVQAGAFLDEDLQPTHTDLLYAVQTTAGQQAFVYVVFEHQSSFDPTMTFPLP